MQYVANYVHLYKNIYRCIICVILALGVSLIPFLDYLVEAPNVKENVTILYLLYLGQTLVTYVFVYKKSVLIADQKDYVVSLFTQAINIVMNVGIELDIKLSEIKVNEGVTDADFQ
mgnify:CR=1 FL=1